MDETTKIAIFKGNKVRKTIHNNEWWFVVEDVVIALTDSSNAKDYINKMRLRDDELSKGYGQFVHTLPVETQGVKVLTLGDPDDAIVTPEDSIVADFGDKTPFIATDKPVYGYGWTSHGGILSKPSVREELERIIGPQVLIH